MKCKMPECQGEVKCKGLCQKHYIRLWAHGDPSTLKRPKRIGPDAACSAEGCDRKPVKRNFCQLHYKRWRKHADPLPDKPARITHGYLSGFTSAKKPAPREYAAWVAMKQRCHNPKNVNYQNYGGRGITVHPKWRTSFAAFIEYLGPKPTSEHTLERIDNNGNYEPGNVCWATRTEQIHNRRSRAQVKADNARQITERTLTQDMRQE